MADSSAVANVTPEKVKHLLSSFLVTPSQSADGAGKTSAENISPPRSGVPESKGKTAVRTKGISTTSLRSHEKFLERVDSFSTLTWFGKPLDLSPIICSRYGWENVDTDMLQCVGCKAFLCGQLPNKTDSQAYEESLTKLRKNLLTSHDKFCLLAVHPCPEHFCHVPVDDPASLLTGFTERTTLLNLVQDKLPRIDETDLQELGYDTGQGGAYCKRHLMPNSDMSPQVVALAFTGWTSCSLNKDVLMCSMCRRQVGLWNFVATCPLAVSRETSKESDDEDRHEDIEPTAKRRKISLTAKQAFNPLGEHHYWCPWMEQTEMLSVPPPSSSNSNGTGTPQQQQNESQTSHRSVPACIMALTIIAPGLMDNNTGLATTMKTSPMFEGLRCFRRVIKTWSSSKVQTTASPPS